MASRFMTGLATGFLDAKADQMKSDRETKVKLATTLAAESRASQRRLKDRLAASQQDYEEEVKRNMDALQLSRKEAEKFALLPKKARGNVVSRAHQRANRQDNVNAVVSNVAGPESDDFLSQVQREVKVSGDIDLFSETQEERAAKLGYTYKNAYDAILSAAGSSFGAMYKDSVYQGMASGIQHDSGKLKFASQEAKRLAGQINDRVEGGERFEDVMADLQLQAMNASDNYEAVRAAHKQGVSSGDESGEGKKEGNKNAPLSVRTPKEARRSMDNIEVGSWIVQPSGKLKQIANEQDLEKLKAWIGQTSPPRARREGTYPPSGRE